MPLIDECKHGWEYEECPRCSLLRERTELTRKLVALEEAVLAVVKDYKERGSVAAPLLDKLTEVHRQINEPTHADEV